MFPHCVNGQDMEISKKYYDFSLPCFQIGLKFYCFLHESCKVLKFGFGISYFVLLL